MNHKQNTIARRILSDGDGSYERTMDYCEEEFADREDDWSAGTCRYQFKDGSVIVFDGPCFNIEES